MSDTDPPPPGPMALLEKYSALNRRMDEARREHASAKTKAESIRQEIQRLRVERHEMDQETERTREETARLHQNVQEALVKSSELEDQATQALMAKDHAIRQLEFTKQFVEEERQGFLEASRDFRTSVKRMRLNASAVGEDMATCKAFLEVHGKEDCIDRNWEDERDEKDEEMEQAILKHTRLKKDREQAERALRAAQAKHKESSQRSTNRSERKAQLRAQLERVQKDNMDLEQQLKALDMRTREARDMAHTYEKDLTRIKSNARGFASTHIAQNPITPSPYTASRSQHTTTVRNPYAKRSNDSNPRSNSNGNATMENNDNAIMGRGMNSQHPHLPRRTRKDRQFGSALEIMSGLEAAEDDEDMPLSQYEAATSQGPIYRTIRNASINLLDDEDDDDDDELLSYVALKKST